MTGRSYDFDEYIAERRGAIAPVIAAMAERGRSVRRKPRTGEERVAIVRMATSRVRRRKETGELVEVGHRLYEFRTKS